MDIRKLRESYRRNPSGFQIRLFIYSVLTSFLLSETLQAILDLGKWERLLYYVFFLALLYVLVIGTLILVEK